MELSHIIIALMVAMSIVAFVAFGVDKYKSKHYKWRIPEATLLLLAFLGGGIGAYAGMKTFHHKTLHNKFTFLVPIFALAQLFAAFWLLGWIF